MKFYYYHHHAYIYSYLLETKFNQCHYCGVEHFVNVMSLTHSYAYDNDDNGMEILEKKNEIHVV